MEKNQDVKKKNNTSKKEETTIKVVEEENKKSLKRKIFDIAFWSIIIILAIIWITDFIRIKNNDKPVFCIVQKTHTYDDGSVDECIGLGYKIYDYNRDTIKGHQFSPFFVGIKE